ncbi:unnamed protein product [Pleuronectes platessa]|uniref:Uncharacterized protein n=1 Tax=Pleuronectes platessa TaxID=8262 RepID=A0A9N7V3H7_PLEPL|nr:unnamed protein product [Pleuronectes platessa]
MRCQGARLCATTAESDLRRQSLTDEDLFFFFYREECDRRRANDKRSFLLATPATPAPHPPTGGTLLFRKNQNLKLVTYLLTYNAATTRFLCFCSETPQILEDAHELEQQSSSGTRRRPRDLEPAPLLSEA